jgi:hypothetical protein
LPLLTSDRKRNDQNARKGASQRDRLSRSVPPHGSRQPLAWLTFNVDRQKKMKPIAPEQYATAFSLVMEEIGGQKMPLSATNTLSAELARAGKTQRKEMIGGMRKLISELEALPADRLHKINALLAEKGLPRLAMFAGDYESEQQAILPAVLARGIILTEEECRAVEDELDDMTSDLTDDQRVQLGEMINQFYDR